MQSGDLVILNVPDNPRLHGASAVVDRLTDWGAHVRTAAAATGRFRASHEEMGLVRADLMLVEALNAARSRRQGYTGDVCCNCQGVRMRRNGACLVCDDCGTSGGCG